MIIGVESSCDESAIALFDPDIGVIQNWVHSQVLKHQVYGGIVPDLASREHLDNFPLIVQELFNTYQPCKGDRIAVTIGPGLAGCLALGMALSQALAVACGLEVMGVNHLRGHAFSPFIGLHEKDPEKFQSTYADQLPHLGLIVSGGNTVLFSISRQRELKILASTVDDAAGEALDKGAKLLGMPYPGGPLVEEIAQTGNSKAFEFPRAFAGRNDYRFSFSGLKTSLRYLLEKMDDQQVEQAMPDICASYQQAVIDALVRKTRHILDGGGWSSLGLSGGVANNKRLRAAFARLGEKRKLPVHIALPEHSGDNAAMVAFAAFVDPDSCQLNPPTFNPSWELA